MQQLLKEKFQAYIINNSPELMVELQASLTVNQYLEDKISNAMPMVLDLLAKNTPGYIIEELALNHMTAELRPSRFNYLQEVLEEEFRESYDRFYHAGVLTYETINMIEACKDIFTAYSFNAENIDNRLLRYAIIAAVHDYLN
jgi:hypothetical protein